MKSVSGRSLTVRDRDSASSVCLWRCFTVPANSCLLSIMVCKSQCNGMCVSAGPDSLRSMPFPPLLGKWLPRRRTGAFHLTVLRGKQEDKCSPLLPHRPGNTTHPTGSPARLAGILSVKIPIHTCITYCTLETRVSLVTGKVATVGYVLF